MRAFRFVDRNREPARYAIVVASGPTSARKLLAEECEVDPRNRTAWAKNVELLETQGRPLVGVLCYREIADDTRWS